jgi:hypothetical protein
MNKFFTKIAIALALVIGSTPAYAGNEVKLKDGKQTSMMIGYDIMDSSGVYWDQDMEAGRFTAVFGHMSQRMEDEWSPSAPTSYGLWTDAAGHEGLAIVNFLGFPDCNNPDRPVISVILKGAERRDDVKVILLDRRVTGNASTLNGQDFLFDAKKFKNDKGYRATLVQQYGTSATAAPAATALLRDRIIPRWDSYNVKGRGLLKTPFTPEQITQLSAINPQYRFGEKLVGTASFSISMDPISTAIGVLFDLVGGAKAKSVGFDANSVVSRAQAGEERRVWQRLKDANNAQCK